MFAHIKAWQELQPSLVKLKPPCDSLLQESRSLRRFETLSKHPLIGVHRKSKTMFYFIAFWTGGNEAQSREH